MAKNKYSYRNTGSKAKPIIITSSIAGAVLIGVLGFMAVRANEENRIAALRYDFNRQFPDTFDTVENIDPEQDTDKDGLNNSAEVLMNTNGTVADSDGDGLVDGDEESYGTNPVSADSDGDGLYDGIEILAGLDPLLAMSDGKVKDSEREFTRTIEFSEGAVTLTGNADIFGATAEQLSLNAVASNAGALTFPYEIYCKTPFTKGELKFKYSTQLVEAAGLAAENIKVFSFNPLSKDYTAVGGEADIGKGEITCEIEGGGVYVVGADRVIQSSVITEDSPLNVHLLIDNSGSMYPKSVQSTSKENDVDFKRLAFASNFVQKLNSNSRVAITAFTYEFKNLCDFTPNKGDAINAVNSIRTIGAGFDGTSVERALMLALDSFTKDMQAERNIIILLTDGISTDTAGITLEKITAQAQAKNVTVMTISLGDEYDEKLLQSIADDTGGKYFQISEANILEGLYSTMLASMENDIVDEDMDGTPDSYTLYDTGFRAEENGFSFENFKSRTNETLDFGMIMLARDWFRRSVPNSVNCENQDISFNFEGTTIDLSQPLHNVSLQSMQASYLKPDTYLDFAKGGNKLCVKKDILEEAQGMGWSVRNVPYSDGKSDWTEYELLYPNHTVARLGTKYSQNDYQLIRAIHYYDSFRDTGKKFTLNNESDLNRLKKILGSGTPVIMKMTWEENGTCYSRYVALTALRRNLENPNLFNLKIYDVNSESVNAVTLKRTMKVSPAKTFTNDFTYSAEWDGKQVSIQFCLTEAE